MKTKVIVSLVAAEGDRCVNILRHGDAGYSFRECHRDGAAAGWQYQVEAAPVVFDTYGQALSAVRGQVGWLGAGGAGRRGFDLT